MRELTASKQARREFFTDQNKRLYEEKLASLSPEEAEKLQTLKEKDSITWFNRTKADPATQTIRGAFYKVRQHGGASEFDNNEINKFYKRSLVCFACLLLHANMTMQFLY